MSVPAKLVCIVGMLAVLVVFPVYAGNILIGCGGLLAISSFSHFGTGRMFDSRAGAGVGMLGIGLAVVGFLVRYFLGGTHGG